MEVVTPARGEPRGPCGSPPLTQRGGAAADERRSARKPRPPVPAFGGTPAQPPQPQPLEPWALLRKVQISSPRKEDNYEISDKDENSADEAEPDRSHKLVPRWCENYLQRLQEQSTLDPDSIFGTKVPKCELEVIFSNEDYRKRSRERPKRKRGSSGEWRKDRLAQSEIAEYKVKMGQTRHWDAENIAANIGVPVAVA